jgi:anti-anti-sigma regulatory factor
MTFRITSIFGKDETIIRLEGSLDAGGVKDLKKAIREAAGNVLLDLSGLRSANEEGVLALQSSAAEGTKLVGASSYILQLLDEKPS